MSRDRLPEFLKDFSAPLIQDLTAEQLITVLDGRFALGARLGATFAQFRTMVLRSQSEGLSCAALAGRLDRLESNGQALSGFVLLPPPANLAGTLRAMTIHAAKGLEFPVVILADVQKRRTAPRAYVKSGQSIWLPARTEDGKLDKSSDEIQEAMAREAQAEIQESARLLYVAMTRAREALFVVDRADPPVEEPGAKPRKRQSNPMFLGHLGSGPLNPK